MEKFIKAYPLLKSGKLTAKNQLLLYKGTLCPTMLYGAETWGSAAPINIQKFQTTQNKIIHTILTASRGTTTEELHHRANMSIANHKNPAARTLNKYKNSDNRTFITGSNNKKKKEVNNIKLHNELSKSFHLTGMLWMERLKVGDCLARPVPVVSITLERHASRMGLSRTLNTGGYPPDQYRH
ncbi:hypothetical protein PR048_009984 [Dryococelus australis]|uniref:Uncharacterized protein n=1 Tax=Dryococelus australis TaxID=614101 RepID=A0ABQ9I1G4_9NEOP|nr:hypothetical protein PR048_009984 [Dryococelus australis]